MTVKVGQIWKDATTWHHDRFFRIEEVLAENSYPVASAQRVCRVNESWIPLSARRKTKIALKRFVTAPYGYVLILEVE